MQADVYRGAPRADGGSMASNDSDEAHADSSGGDGTPCVRV